MVHRTSGGTISNLRGFASIQLHKIVGQGAGEDGQNTATKA